MTEITQQSLQTAESISNYGLMTVIAAFFVVLSAIMMVAVCRTRMRITLRRSRMRMSGRVWTTTKETEIGVQRRRRVPSAVPRELSPTNSGLTSKRGHGTAHVPER